MKLIIAHMSCHSPPAHRVRPGFVQIALGPEPVRITLDQRGQP
jgi:hypothetical protein